MGLMSIWKNKIVNKNLLSGLLPRTDIATLKNIRNKPLSSHRKMIYKKWICTDCKHEVFYMARSCVLCESTGIVENSISTGIYAK